MANLHIIFSVAISDEKYYGGIHGNAECKIDVPEELAESLEPGNMLMLCMKAAFAEFKQFQGEMIKVKEE